MVYSMPLLNFNVVGSNNLLRTESTFVDESHKTIVLAVHIFFSHNSSRGHRVSTTCEPFIEEVTLPTILCHIYVTTLSVPGHDSLSQMN